MSRRNSTAQPLSNAKLPTKRHFPERTPFFLSKASLNKETRNCNQSSNSAESLGSQPHKKVVEVHCDVFVLRPQFDEMFTVFCRLRGRPLAICARFNNPVFFSYPVLGCGAA